MSLTGAEVELMLTVCIPILMSFFNIYISSKYTGTRLIILMDTSNYLIIADLRLILMLMGEEAFPLVEFSLATTCSMD